MKGPAIHARPRQPDSSDGAVDPRLERVVAQCLSRIETDGLQAALEGACSDHPELAQELREQIRVLLRTGLLGSADGEDAPFPERLGPFLLRSRIGGGMGVVYLAEQSDVGRKVALKLIRPEHLYFPGSRERFRREVEAIGRLRHPNVVPIYSAGEEQGIPYFAMELLEGRTLAAVLAGVAGREPHALGPPHMARAAGDGAGDDATVRERFGRSWIEACLRVALQIAQALEHAHGRGVVHRDVKPSNIFVTTEGKALLFDFGLSLAKGASRLTLPGRQVGSLPYQAPEQLRGEVEAGDPSCDVYALGVTLYEMLAAEAPFLAESASATQRKILEGRPRALRGLNSAVTRDVELVCQTAMQADREQRYASASALARDLRNVLDIRPILARPPGMVYVARRFAARHRALVATVAVAVLLLATAVVRVFIAERETRASLREVKNVAQELLTYVVDEVVEQRPAWTSPAGRRSRSSTASRGSSSRTTLMIPRSRRTVRRSWRSSAT